MSCKVSRQDLRIAKCPVHLSGHTLRSKSRKGERARHRATSAMRFVINQIVFFKGADRDPRAFRARMVMKTVARYSPITFPATKETEDTRVSLTKTKMRTTTTTTNHSRKTHCSRVRVSSLVFSHCLCPACTCIRAFEITEKKQSKSFLQICRMFNSEYAYFKDNLKITLQDIYVNLLYR